MIVLDTHVWLWWISNPEKLPAKATTAIDSAIKTSGIAISSISTWEMALLTVALPGTFHPDPADRIIVATAMVTGSSLVTKDKKIRNYPFVKTIWD